MKQVNCNLCGHDDYRVRFGATSSNASRPEIDAFRCTSATYGQHPRIVQCSRCGHVYANPRWDSDELLDAYAAVEDETYVLEQSSRKRTFVHHLQALEKFSGPGGGRPLLDVGAYTGVFVEVACSRNWQAIGVEPSLWASSLAQSQGIPVFQGTLDMDELGDRRFDVITMWDVIEHLDDPTAEIAKARSLLKAGGLMAIHTMDVNSLAAKVMGRRWPWLMDMHVHYFSQGTMRRLLTENGLEVVWIGAQGRYLSLGYLASRLGGLSRRLGRLAGGVVEVAGLNEVAVRVNFGDLFTAYARRPAGG